MKTIGEIIREKRLKHGWSLEALSKKLGVHISTISLWERDLREPKIFAMCDLADIFGCSLDELCGRTWRCPNEK